MIHLILALALLQTAAPVTPQIAPIEVPPGTFAPHTIRYKLPSAEVATVGRIAVSHGWQLVNASDTAGEVVNGETTLSFTYVPSTEVLTIVITAKPWNISEGEIFGEIYSWFYTPIPCCAAQQHRYVPLEQVPLANPPTPKQNN